MKRTKLRKVYSGGGALIGPIAGTAATIIDTFETKKPQPAMSALKGAASGAAMGTAIAPGWGTAVGAVVGGAAGLIQGKKQRREYENQEGVNAVSKERAALAYSSSVLSANPAALYGNQISGYYALGGTLARNLLAGIPAEGGNLKPLSSKHTEVQGPGHEQGGVTIPMYNAELEGQETTSGPKVFSHALGFAQLHKPIAKAIGKIEKKPATEERINALKRLQERENELFELQEHIKAYSNVQ